MVDVSKMELMEGQSVLKERRGSLTEDESRHERCEVAEPRESGWLYAGRSQ